MLGSIQHTNNVKGFSMKSKKLRRFLIAALFVALLPFIVLEGISIYSYLHFMFMPSATEQLLDFVEIPRNTELLGQNAQTTDVHRSSANLTDFQPVEAILVQRFPTGTSKQEVERFVAKQDCSLDNEKILCSFKSVWYPPYSSKLISPIGFIAACSNNVYLTFSFDSSSRLDGIKIIGVTNCV
jgi:hypothetical protein